MGRQFKNWIIGLTSINPTGNEPIKRVKDPLKEELLSFERQKETEWTRWLWEIYSYVQKLIDYTGESRSPFYLLAINFPPMNHISHNRVGRSKAHKDSNMTAGKDFNHKLNKHNTIKLKSWRTLFKDFFALFSFLGMASTLSAISIFLYLMECISSRCK